MRAISLLSALKFRNGMRTLLTDPRKLVPFLIFLVIVAGSIALALWGIERHITPGIRATLRGDEFSAGVLIALILLGLGFIDSGLGDNLLAFGASDVDYLFPSPISRRLILAYRLPGLMFGNMFMAGFALFAFGFATQFGQPRMESVGHTIAPAWAAPAALYLSGGIYMNLSMFIAISVPNRAKYHRILAFGVLGLCGAIGLLGWLRGMTAIVAVMRSPIVHWVFLPSTLGAQSLIAGYAKQPTTPYLGWLLLGYAISLIPMFLSKSNWFEQSIASTERVSRFRSAARGGYATLMAARASSFKYKGDRPYTVPPFGKGAMALFWAHLCAAGKKPLANFITPLLGGLGVGAFGAIATIKNQGSDWQVNAFGYAGILMVVAYGSLGFMTTAKTASESAMRRRELISPLPMKGWQTVAANLATPYCSGLLFFFGCALMYMSFLAPNWPILGFFIAITLAMRLAARMALQYIIGVTYPDAADKVQQFFAVGIYGLISLPFIGLEALVCAPGIILKSIWIALIPLTLLQIPLAAVFLIFAGRATERSVATGEKVTIVGLIRGR